MSAILTLMGKHAQAIILCGGFGRGEGGVIVEDVGIHFVNDIDVIVILKGNFLWLYRKYARKVQQLADKLSDELGIKQIDIGLRNEWLLRSAPLTVANYELLHGHKVLYGDVDLFNLMPNYESDDIPMKEGTVYFLNRGSGLLISAKYLGDEGMVPLENWENFIIECQKAIMAIGDSFLILNGDYHYSYPERMRRFQELELSDVPNAQRILSLYIDAMNNKIYPDFSKYDDLPPFGWWLDIRKIFGEFFLLFESKRLGTTINDWMDYSEKIGSYENLSWKAYFQKMIQKVLQENGLINLVRPGIFSEVRKGQMDYLLAVMPLLLFSYKRNGFEDTMIGHAAALLDMRCGGDAKAKWNNLVNRYLMLWHPEGEAGKVAKEEQT